MFNTRAHVHIHKYMFVSVLNVYLQLVCRPSLYLCDCVYTAYLHLCLRCVHQSCSYTYGVMVMLILIVVVLVIVTGISIVIRVVRAVIPVIMNYRYSRSHR